MIDGVAFTTRPELRGTFGMVSSTHWLASQCGMAVLEQGGNAFDAAVAAGFVLQVVEPHLNGLGGDLPIVLWDSSRGRAEVICGQGPAPKAATIESIRALGLEGHLAELEAFGFTVIRDALSPELTKGLRQAVLAP